MSRKDCKQACRIPICVIPAGTANGFASQFNLMDPINAAFRIMRGGKQQLDLMKLTQGNISIYCFQSILWGLASDFGATTSWSNILKVATALKTYSGKIEYQLPIKEGEKTFCSLNTSTCPQCSLYESDDEDLEENWNTIEDSFILVTACNMSKVSNDIYAAPFAHLADGLIDIVVVDSACPRPQLLNLMSTLSNGAYVNTPQFNLSKNIQYLRVKAFRLSSNESGKFCVDGEFLPSSDPINVTSERATLSIIV